MTKQQTMGFQTEVKQMLHLVIHSLYSNKEIFLRELISNASDALDKLRFLALSDASLYENNPDLKIVVVFNNKLKTLTIKDNGIGLTWDEAVDSLGTIAKSGTKEFLSHLTGEQSKDSHLIGQFGVGFYSAFIVADKVTVKSRKAGLKATDGIIWQSNGEGEFTIKQEDKSDRGTEVILHLKKEAEEFLTDWRLRSIIHKYSDHICWPIMMKKEKPEAKEEETQDEKEKQQAKTPEIVVETKKEDSEFETINKATALWILQKSEIKDEDYKEFYKHIAHDMKEPLIWSHNHVEGKHEYISLLYIPAHAPFDLWQQDMKHGLKLYVKRVFILDDVTQFLPRYLRFVKGIIDAGTLPLNISREILQENKEVDAIKSACTKRVLIMLDKLSKDEDCYQRFWQELGLALKEGPIEDYANREAVAKLLRFASTYNDSEKQTVSLDAYIERMPKNQDKIYYLTAGNYNAAKNSPHLEIFKEKNIEVLLLTDRIDEWLVSYLSEFAGKKLQSISKGKIDFPKDDKKEEDKKETNSNKEEEQDFSSMLEQIKVVLKDKVKEVRFTNRLTNSPACIIADEFDMGLEMRRILQSAGQKVPDIKPIFEVNPKHALIKRLHEIQDDNLFSEWVLILFEEAILAEGGHLENPAGFVARVNKLLELINY